MNKKDKKDINIILINGTTGVGKDYWAVHSMLPNHHLVRCGDSIRSRTLGAFGIEGPIDQFDNKKDRPLEEFGGLTFREALMKTSDFLKPILGEDFIGEMVADEIEFILEHNTVYPVFITVVDSGYLAEAQAIYNRFKDSCNIAQVKLSSVDQEDNTTEDNREYWDIPGIPSVSFLNKKEEDSVHKLDRLIINMVGLEVIPDGKGLITSFSYQNPSTLDTYINHIVEHGSSLNKGDGIFILDTLRDNIHLDFSMSSAKVSFLGIKEEPIEVETLDRFLNIQQWVAGTTRTTRTVVIIGDVTTETWQYIQHCKKGGGYTFFLITKASPDSVEADIVIYESSHSAIPVIVTNKEKGEQNVD